MNDIKDPFAEGVRDVGPCRSIADIHQKLMLSQIDTLEVESGSVVVAQLTELWINWLLRRDLRPIYTKISNRIDDEAEVIRGCFEF